MLKVLEPIEAKSDDKVFSKAETTVKIPTNAVIPMAIINTVSMVRNNWVLMEPKAIRTFSLNNLNIVLI
jgi:molybdopterin biosynthesis enzyme